MHESPRSNYYPRTSVVGTVDWREDLNFCRFRRRASAQKSTLGASQSDFVGFNVS